nr:MAG: hypothetical protein [Bacteriophage sp.]
MKFSLFSSSILLAALAFSALSDCNTLLAVATDASRFDFAVLAVLMTLDNEVLTELALLITS